MNFRKVHVLSHNRRPTNSEYKYMVLLLKTLHIIFGLDLGFFRHKSIKFRFCVNTVIFIHCLIIGGLTALNYYINDSYLGIAWSTIYYLEYLATVFMLSLFKRKTTFKSFLEKLEEIDMKLNVDFSRSYTEFKFIFVIIIIFYVRLFVIGFNCFDLDCGEYFVDMYNYLILSFCSDVCITSLSVVFYSLDLRLAKLAPMLETNDDIDFIQYLYKDIVDTVEKYKTVYDNIFMLQLICNVPQLMTGVYSTLKIFQDTDDELLLLGLASEYIGILQLTIVTIAPAFLAEMLTTEAEKLKSVLHEKLIQQDVNNEVALSRFIRYVEARPCRFQVLKLVPLNADFIAMLLSFCVTYLIVIIQFTHLK